MRRLVLMGAAAGLLLAACAPVPVRKPADQAALAAQAARERQLAGVEGWTLEGHLAVSDGHDGGSGTLTWTQNGERYDFDLRAPITGKSFRLSGGPDGAVLEGVEGGPLRGPDAETLMRRALGWEVPLRELRAWVLGLRAPGGAAELSFGEHELPALLQQDGWAVDYRAWDLSRQPPLPQKVFASQPPYKVKLSIDSFRLAPAPCADCGR
ncbi:MAG TPA: lipoprotein insertase outer membrane protein LolB [Frateuria sp.]|uniref:lipoprotein insertase outer membrane protein LolB n=1 Tax=Frateuria sp. TaxID=2211372 RepID=UPI002DEF8F3D|nr:lipoprotein insertase outer membrane protein LolB [Frateuria sp.]